MTPKKPVGTQPPPKGSFPGSFSKDDLSKVATGAIVAMGGALCTYLISYMGSLNLNTNEGILMTAACGILVNTIRKYLSNTTSL